MLTGPIRYLSYLIIFFVGFTLVANVVKALVPEPYSDPASLFSAFAFVAWFVFWTRRREARSTKPSQYEKRSAVAEFVLSCLAAVGGLVLVITFAPLLSGVFASGSGGSAQMLFAIFLGPIVLAGVTFFFLGLRGMVRYFKKARRPEAPSARPSPDSNESA